MAGRKKRAIRTPKETIAAPEMVIEPLTDTQVETLVVDPITTIQVEQAVRGGIKEGDSEAAIVTNTGLTCDDIRGMTVIQIHKLIKSDYPQFIDLLEIYNRDRLQNQLMFKLGL
jgi:hypothetical protein